MERGVRSVCKMVCRQCFERELRVLLAISVDLQGAADITGCISQVAIEALGPLKVLRNRPAATGRAVHRQRVLTAMGWKVVPLREKDWAKLKNLPEKQAFLQQLVVEPFCML